jgi:hypothetical protein
MAKPFVAPVSPAQADSEPLQGELLFPGDSSGDEARRLWVKLLSTWMDNAFEIPGLRWRFGLDPIIGLVPVVGDVASTVVSFYILSVAAHLQVPRSTLARMGLNVAIDYVVGSIPLVGNVFDFAWRANYRNVQLLERYLSSPLQERRRSGIWDWMFVAMMGALLLAMFIGSLVIAILIATWLARLLHLAP